MQRKIRLLQYALLLFVIVELLAILVSVEVMFSAAAPKSIIPLLPQAGVMNRFVSLSYPFALYFVLEILRNADLAASRIMLPVKNAPRIVRLGGWLQWALLAGCVTSIVLYWFLTFPITPGDIGEVVKAAAGALRQILCLSPSLAIVAIVGLVINSLYAANKNTAST